MNIEKMNMVNSFVGYKVKRIVANPPKTLTPFAPMLSKLITENTSKINNLSQEEFSAKSSQAFEDEVAQSSELEDKYCSLCGSMIKEDGSCPICIVPTFISGKGQSHGQNISQTAYSNSIVGKHIIVSSGNNKI